MLLIKVHCLISVHFVNFRYWLFFHAGPWENIEKCITFRLHKFGGACEVSRWLFWRHEGELAWIWTPTMDWARLRAHPHEVMNYSFSLLAILCARTRRSEGCARAGEGDSERASKHHGLFWRRGGENFFWILHHHWKLYTWLEGACYVCMDNILNEI